MNVLPYAMKKFLVTATTLTLCFLCFTLKGQNGSVSGLVTNAETGDSLSYAKVYLDGTAYGAYAKGGIYKLENVAPGSYTIVCTYRRTWTKKIENVVVNAGQDTKVDIQLGEAKIETGHKTVIKLHVQKEDEAAAVEEVKKETKVVEVVSSKEMSKKGDSKVADVAKRASGVTVVGGKYVYVRGLSDRYSKTTLNGSEIPGLDPNTNSVQLDLFPSAFVRSLKIIKTFSPDLPGDFAGGLIDIRTKEYPDSFYVKVSLGGTYNPQTSFNDKYLTYEGGNNDWLGFDDGTRAIPDNVDRAIENDVNGTAPFPDLAYALASDENAQEYNDLVESLNSTMTPVSGNSLMDHNLTITTGNKFPIKTKKDTANLKHRTFGFFAGLSYRRSFNHYTEGDIGTYKLTGIVTGKDSLNFDRKLKETKSSDYVLVGTVFDATLKLNDDNKIGFNYLRNHSGQTGASIAEGTFIEDPSIVFRNQTLSYQFRSINALQLYGDHSIDTLPITKSKGRFEWKQAVTFARQDEPDLRFWTDDYVVNGDGSRAFNFSPIYNRPARYSRFMKEIDYDGKYDLTFILEKEDTTSKYKRKEAFGKIKIGASTVLKTRDFTEKRIDYIPNSNSVYNGNSEDFLHPDNIGVTADGEIGAGLANNTFAKNQYTGFQSVIGSYAMTEIPVLKKVDFIGGIRVEATNISAISDDESVEEASIFTVDPLPSVNFVYKIWDAKKVEIDSNKTVKKDIKLRLSYNRTLGRPNFRELAPFAVEDYTSGVVVKGNPDLDRTLINNFDIRTEYYPNSKELFSIAGFFKTFQNPIELGSVAESQTEYEYRNVESAFMYGTEIEFRKTLGFIAPAFENFKLGVNASLVASFTQIQQDELDVILATDIHHEDTRPLYGQSPYIANAIFEYDNDSIGLSANFTFNVFGERIVRVQQGGTPNIYEKPRPVLDFNLQQKLGKRFSVRVRIRNILNPETKWVYEFANNNNGDYKRIQEQEYIFRRFRRGRKFSLSLSYVF